MTIGKMSIRTAKSMRLKLEKAIDDNMHESALYYHCSGIYAARILGLCIYTNKEDFLNGELPKKKQPSGFLWDCWDISATYVTFVLLHRWNKIDRRGFEFLEELGWSCKGKARMWLWDKPRELNKDFQHND